MQNFNPVGTTTQAVGGVVDNASTLGVEAKWQHHDHVNLSETKPKNEAGLRAEGATALQPTQTLSARKFNDCKVEIAKWANEIATVWLAEYGADTNGKPLNSSTMEAQGAHANRADKEVSIPLHDAVRKSSRTAGKKTGKKDIQKLCKLIDKCDSIDQTDKNGNTALHHAAINSNVLAITLLLRNGKADSSIENNDGQTACDLMSKKCIMELKDAISIQEALNI